MYWTTDQIIFLLILRDILNLSYASCADNMTREYKRPFTKNACLAKYFRAKQKGLDVPQHIVREVMG